MNNLNFAGDALAEDLAVGLAAELDIPEGAIRGLIRVSRATTSEHRYVVDSSSAVGAQPSEFERGSRTWRDAARPADFFKRGELVWIVNFGDDRVCAICLEKTKDKLVYTIEEARALLPFHVVGCRCRPVPARTINRLPDKFMPEAPRLQDVAQDIVGDFQLRLGELPGIVLNTVVK